MKPEKVEAAPVAEPAPIEEPIPQVSAPAPIQASAPASAASNTEDPSTEQDAKQAIEDMQEGGGGKKKKEEVKGELTPNPTTLDSSVKSTLEPTTSVDSGTIARTTRAPYVTDKDKKMAAIKNTADIVYAGKVKPKKPRNQFEIDLSLAVDAGDLAIDNADGTLKRPEIGHIETAANSVANFFSKIGEGWSYASKTDEEKSAILEKHYQENLLDLGRINQHTNTEFVADMGSAVVTTMGITAGLTALGVGEVGSGGAASPFVLPAMAAGIYTLGTIWNTTREKEIETYNISRSNGADQTLAYKNSKELRPVFYTTGIAEGMIQGMVGAQTGVMLTSVEKQAAGSVIKYYGKTMLTRTPEIIGSTLVSGGLESYRSIKMKDVTGADIDVYGRVKDVTQQTFALNLAFGAIPSFYSAGKMYVNKQLKSATLNLMATQDKTWVNNELMGMRQRGLLTEEQHNTFMKDLDEYQQMKKATPGIPEDKAPAVVGLLLKKKGLEKSATQLKVNDPTRADLDVQIKQTQERIEKAMNGEDPFDAEINDITNQPLSQEQNATTTTAQQQQAGEATGSISKYQGAESEQAQKTNQADNSNSVISGQTQKIKQPEWVTKLFGVIPGEKITVNEKTALKRFLIGQQDAANGAVKWVKTARQDISNGLNELVGAGKIKTTQLQSILKRYDNLNLQNKAAVDKFTEYASNVINDATYAESLDRANLIKSKISNLSKGKNLQTNISEAAKEFLSIKPGDVSDLSAYMAKANEVYEGISRPARTKNGAKFSQAFDEKSVYDYVQNESNIITEKAKANRMADYQELVDKKIVTEDMTLDEMETIISDIENTGTTAVENADSKVKSIRISAEDRFGTLAAIADNILNKGEDGFGNKVEVTMNENDKRLLKDFIKVGIKDMSVEDAYRAVQALDNFVVNGKHSGLEKPLHSYYGAKNAEYSGKIINSIPMSSAGRLAYDLSGTVPMLFRNLFGAKDVDVMKSMGFTDYYNAISEANISTKALVDDFITEFGERKPNGLKFDDADNIYEMGLFAHLLRNSGGTEKEIADEFARRVRLFDGSIENLKASNKADHKKMAEYYQRARVKLLDGANNIEDVTARMDKHNVDAVNWWINKWDEKYNSMSDLAKNYYNKTLKKDFNYTPDIFKKIKPEDAGFKANDADWENGYVMSATDYFPASESSTLKATKGPDKVGEGNYISIDFFKDMETKYRQSLYDLNGSKYIAQMKSFINHPGYKNLFKGNPEDADMLAKRVRGYANKTRGAYANNFDMSDWSGFAKGMTTFNKIATASTLAGTRQIFQQLTPMVNAFAQTGKLPIQQAMFNPHIIELMNNSNRDIALTNYEGDVSFKPNEQYMQSAMNNKNTLVKAVDQTSSLMLRAYVQYPDKVARRVGWWAFYTDKLAKNGVDVEDIDWSTHKLDDAAADYAQQMVNTTQNVVQTELKGMIGSSKNPTTSLIKNAVMPLSDFMINQKLNFWSNLNKSFSKSSSIQDRTAALTGVAGIMVEAAVFNAVKRGYSDIYNWVADKITGHEPSQKEMEDRERRANASAATNVITDLAPLPPQLNASASGGANFILQKYYDANKIPDEIRMEIGTFKPKGIGSEAGLFGMGLGAVATGGEMISAGITGDIDKTVNGHDKEFKLIKQDRNTAVLWGSISTIQAAGIPLPSDVKQITNGVLNRLKQKALDETEYREYLTNKKLGRLIKKANIPMKVIDGKNIVDNYAYSLTINDPLSRGKYLADMYTKFGKDEFNTLTENLKKGAETETDIKRKSIITDKDYFMTQAILSKEQEQIDMAYALSFKTPEANSYKLFELRQKSPSVTQFYMNLGLAMETGAISRDALTQYTKYVKEKIPNSDSDIMLLDKFFQASKMSKMIPAPVKKD